MVRPKNKREVNYLEFDGGYVLVSEAALTEIIERVRIGEYRKNELRGIAGCFERSALHKKSKVDIYRIVNQDSQKKGIKRLTHKEIDEALQNAETTLVLKGKGQKKPVARKFLKHIAKGACSSAEAVLLFQYCLRRTRQPKPYMRLVENERYARFKYGDLSDISGFRRATLCDAFARLVSRGFLNAVPVAKQNENTYGLLYIDGPLVSLSRNRLQNKPYRLPATKNKTVTPVTINRNAPPDQTVTLINKDPKNTNIKIGTHHEREKSIETMRKLLRHPKQYIRSMAQRALQDLEAMPAQAA